MEIKEVASNVDQLCKQRNLFLALTILLAASCTGLTLKIMSTNEKLIMVPGLNQEVWTTDMGVSKSYLEEMTLTYLPLLLDLSSLDIEYKAQVVMKYVSQSDPKYLKIMQDYFAIKKEDYKKFGLWTAFKPKSFDIDCKNLNVIANGTLQDMFGERGNVVTNAASYLITYEWLGGHLLIKEFVKIANEKDRPHKSNFMPRATQEGNKND